MSELPNHPPASELSVSIVIVLPVSVLMKICMIVDLVGAGVGPSGELEPEAEG